MTKTTAKAPSKFRGNDEVDEYSVASSSLSVNDKLKILEQIGRPELIDAFKDWQPRQAKAKKRGAPLDQRVSITVTDKERMDLQNDILQTNKSGEKTTVSHFVRNRARASIDIQGWREIAEKALTEIEAIENDRSDLVKRERQIKSLIEDEDDSEQIHILEKELSNINQRLSKVIARSENRKNRLSGRMTMVEAETVKWRAARLSISTSDYLRFLIFNLQPDSPADSHMSLDAKRRFYISIIEVAANGWGDPPTIAHCTQCVNYIEEIRKLRDRVNQLETYL